jgi:hypothetical protein
LELISIWGSGDSQGSGLLKKKFLGRRDSCEENSGPLVLTTKGVLMSWNKNTVPSFVIDRMMIDLHNNRRPYTLFILGYVPGHGLNDDFETEYPIRRLEYGNDIIQEIMLRDPDCDGDDVIEAREYSKEDLPNLPLEKSLISTYEEWESY